MTLFVIQSSFSIPFSVSSSSLHRPVSPESVSHLKSLFWFYTLHHCFLLQFSLLPIQPHISFLPLWLPTTLCSFLIFTTLPPLLCFKPSPSLMRTSAGASRRCFPWQTGSDTEQTGGKKGGGSGGERQREAEWVDGDDRNNENEQDRMKDEEGDEMWKKAECHFTL